LDNLTHTLVGLTAAKAGLERLSPGAALLCALAANAPDADVVVLAFGDRWDFLLHHRGITHAIVGVVFLALLLPLIFAGVDRLWAWLRKRPPKTKFRGLLIASAVASATHPVLDWTNNYGIRFLLPWNPRWFYGDLVFIVDPFIWVVLGGAAFLLASKGKISKLVWATLATIIIFLILEGPRSSDLPNPILIANLWIGAQVLIIVLFVTGARERWGSKIAFVAFGIVLAYWARSLLPTRPRSVEDRKKLTASWRPTANTSRDTPPCRRSRTHSAGTSFSKPTKRLTAFPWH
jgi:inner membrane protein